MRPNQSYLNDVRLNPSPAGQGRKSTATFERTGDHTGHEATDGPSARCFNVLDGCPMLEQLSLKSDVSTRMSPPLELRFENGEGVIEGYASAFGGPPDSYGDIIAKGAFVRTLAEHRRENTMPAMLWAHDTSRPTGRWLAMSEDDFGLRVRGALNLATQDGRDAHSHLKSGDVNGLSIGFVVSPDGKSRAGSANVLTDLDLVEVSIVTLPANRRARIGKVKTLGSKADLVDMLREGGLPKAAAARIAAGGWPAFAGEDHQKAIDLAAEIQRATANLRTK